MVEGLTVVIECPFGLPEKVVVFDTTTKMLPYVKAKLKSCGSKSSDWAERVDAIETLEDVLVIIEEEAIYSLQVYEVSEINPTI